MKPGDVLRKRSDYMWVLYKELTGNMGIATLRQGDEFMILKIELNLITGGWYAQIIGIEKEFFGWIYITRHIKNVNTNFENTDLGKIFELVLTGEDRANASGRD
jgi:hypothetical protein